jgi:AcrR family transcriptional regulator
VTWVATLSLVTIARSPRVRQVGDAAIAVLAEQGARGLTHRAVDAAAGLPPGTTSNYARTRVALLTLALARIAELDTADGVRHMPGPQGPQGSQDLPDEPVSPFRLAEGLAWMLHRMITDAATRRRVLARFELAFEAARRPELRAAYDELGQDFRDQAARLLAAAGSVEPERDAWTLIAWMEGTAFYALAGAGAPAPPTADTMRTQLTGLIASMCDPT